MPDISCAPACDPKVPTTLSAISGGPSATGAPLPGSSCANPSYVSICSNVEFDHHILCDPATNQRVIIVTSYSVTGVPTTAAYVLGAAAGTMAPYTGNLSLLVTCPDIDLESDAQVMCNGTTTFDRWIVKKDGKPTGQFFDTDSTGAIYTPVGPVTYGACSIALIVNAGVATIAGGTRAATAAFSGAQSTFTTATVPAKLQSITIAAKGVTDGLPNLTGNQVRITAPNGTVINMFDGETRSFSVVRDQDDSLRREYVIAATGNAYANISYTFV